MKPQNSRAIPSIVVRFFSGHNSGTAYRTPETFKEKTPLKRSTVKKIVVEETSTRLCLLLFHFLTWYLTLAESVRLHRHRARLTSLCRQTIACLVVVTVENNNGKKNRIGFHTGPRIRHDKRSSSTRRVTVPLSYRHEAINLIRPETTTGRDVCSALTTLTALTAARLNYFLIKHNTVVSSGRLRSPSVSVVRVSFPCFWTTSPECNQIDPYSYGETLESFSGWQTVSVPRD